jgi:hypothetical protein
MAAVRADRFDAPSGVHDARVLAWTRSVADDSLAGRTVWCAAALPAGRVAANRLLGLLRGRLVARPLGVAAPEPPASLAGTLDAMLAGAGRPLPLGAAAREAFERGADEAETTVAERIAPGDVVVLHDTLTLLLARPVRERGAHAVWNVAAPRGSLAPGFRAAQTFLDPHAAAVDAFVIAWRERRVGVDRVAALLPAAGLVDVKDVATSGGHREHAQRRALAWTSILGDVVEADRDDCVGGTLHVRPAVAPR